MTTNRPPSCDKLKPELKECVLPWCQCRANLINDSGHYVECECGIRTDCFTSPALAVAEWNSIPRRSEVAELLRLVDASIIGTPTPAEERLQTYANKLRKEWKL